MARHKLLSFILASTIIGVGFNGVVSPVSSVKAQVINEESKTYDFSSLKDYEGYDNIDLLGQEYDLSNMESGFLLVVTRLFDRINSGNLTDDEIKKERTILKELLDSYIKDKESVSNIPITLEYGPSNMLIDEVRLVQNKIDELTKENDRLKDTKMSQEYIDAKTLELEEEIMRLKRWINYSIFHFSSKDYKGVLIDNTLNQVKNEIMNYIYVDSEGKPLALDVYEDGSYSIKNSDVTIDELSLILDYALEYENIKLRNLYKEIEMVNNSKITDKDKKDKISELNKQVEDVKAYALGNEIVLLNLERDAISLTKLPSDEIERRVNNLNSEINKRLLSIKNYKEDPSYVISSEYTLGTKPSYTGYVFSDESGFSFKLNLDDKNNIVFENVIGETPTLNEEDKSKLRDIINREIKFVDEDLKFLSEERESIEKGDSENKYYLLDAIDKFSSVRLNDKDNYNIFLEKLS